MCLLGRSHNFKLLLRSLRILEGSSPLLMQHWASLGVVTGFIFGITPAIFLRRSSPYEVLKRGGRTSATGSAGLSLRRLLVAAELALALVLLTGAGLMVKSFWRMNSRPPGFVPECILTLQAPLSGPISTGLSSRRGDS